MLSCAREKAGQAGVTNIEFRCVDGETLDFPANTFDAATIRRGLMFMPEPVAWLLQQSKQAQLKQGITRLLLRPLQV